MLSQTVKHSLGCKILADSWHTITNHLFFDDYSLQPYHRQWHYWYISGTQLFLSTDASFQYLVKRLLARPLMCQAEQSCSLPATGQDCWPGCWLVRQIIAVHSQSLAKILLTCQADHSWWCGCWWGCWMSQQLMKLLNCQAECSCSLTQRPLMRLLTYQAERSCSLPVIGLQTVDMSGRAKLFTASNWTRDSWWGFWHIRQSVAVQWTRDCWWGCWHVRQSVAAPACWQWPPGPAPGPDRRCSVGLLVLCWLGLCAVAACGGEHSQCKVIKCAVNS